MSIDIEKLKKNFLNECYYYPTEHEVSPADTEACQRVFTQLKNGLYEQAAIEAGKNPVACEIFSRAADAAEKTEGKWKS